MGTPIQNTDLEIYLSGGNGNTDPDASLGGIISTTAITDDSLHNLFAKVGAAEALAGSTKYRGIYIKNNHATLTAESVLSYISSQTTSPDSAITISIANEGASAAMQTIADEDTAPTGEVFVTADGVANGLSMGDLAPADFYGVWVKRVISPNATAFGSDTAILGWRCESTSSV